MKKIPTIFLRDFSPESKGRRVTREPHPDCAWVFAGEGTPTRKLDGTCVCVSSGSLFKRREIKKGKPTPVGFILEEEDDTTGKAVGWVIVDRFLAENKWHSMAYQALCDIHNDRPHDGTYELVGPKINGNPEGFRDHMLVAHNDPSLVLPDFGGLRTYNSIMTSLANRDIEGIVWHHPDGRMAKIKKRDFGMARKLKGE